MLREPRELPRHFTAERARAYHRPMVLSSYHRGTLLLALTACSHASAPASPDAAASDATAAHDVGAIDTAIDVYDGGCIDYDASQLDGAAIVAGQMLAVALKCSKCHGDALAGNAAGVMSPQTEGGLAYPPNLTPDPTNGLGCWTNGQIAAAILDGIDDQGQPLCPPMPHFADKGLDASGADDLVTFLRSIHPAYMTVPDTPPCTQADDDAGDAADDSAEDAASDG